MKYQVEIPDLDYWARQIKCQMGCPVLTPAGQYVQAIADQDYERAYYLARYPNPFVYVCGRVCDHPCETECRRGDIDQPIAIRDLKRTATDHHHLGYGHAPGLRVSPNKEAKVAVVGAGPAGLSCAHDLARMGYQVTVFEAQSVPGGMMFLGLPEYRLSRDIIRFEVDAILHLGIELRTGMAIGRDFSLHDLWTEGYRAVFLAIGCHRSRDLRIEGAELDGVLKGVDFLLNINLGYKLDLGERVAVIGGGNVAMDVARSAIRMAGLEGVAEEELSRARVEIARQVSRIREQGGVPREEMGVAVDVARLALRRGAKQVHMVCLESRAQMPAHEWEVREALEEGVILHCSQGPKRIIGDDGHVSGLETITCASVFDSQGRFNPTFVPGTEQVIPADSVILAIGQAADLSFLQPEDGVQVSPRGSILVNPEMLTTTAPGVFAGGDVAFGPRNIIRAIADGQQAARSIEEHISGERQRRYLAKMTVLSPHQMWDGYDRIPRQQMPTLPLDRRIGIAEVEMGLPDAAAIAEGKRCLHCNVNTIYDSDKCILCGGCVDVCPYQCYLMVPAEQLVGGPELEGLLKARCGDGPPGTAIVKDEEKCIRCGLCAKRCPTGAITMERFEMEGDTIA